MSQVPIPNDWDGQTFCCHVVEWPSSPDWAAILYGLITWPQRGRFWDGSTGSIKDAQQIGEEIFNKNILEGCAMGCLDELKVSIDCLCEAIYNTQCGAGGSGGSGSTAQTPADFVDNGSNYPSGYNNRQEYDVAKCNLSRLVIDRMVNDLERLRPINAGSTSASALATILTVVLLTPIPFDDLLVGIAAALLGLAAVATGAIATAISELQLRVSAMDICLIYEAADVETAVSEVHGWIASGSYSYQTLTVQLGTYMVGTDAVNDAFSENSETEDWQSLPTGDCSSCEQAEWWTCQFGVILESGPDYAVIQSAVAGDGDYWVSIGKQDVVPASMETSIISGSPTPPDTSPQFATAIEYGPTLDLGCGAGVLNPWDFTSSSWPTGLWPDAGIIQYRSGTSITIRVDVVF